MMHWEERNGTREDVMESASQILYFDAFHAITFADIYTILMNHKSTASKIVSREPGEADCQWESPPSLRGHPWRADVVY